MTQLVPLARITDSVRGGAVSIGNFDGVHLGHAALLSEARRMADRIGGPAVAVVFDPHPAAILRPEAAPAKLTWLERRAELLDPIGIDSLVVCEVTHEFLRMSAATFFDRLIVEQLAARGIVEGPNFFFGHRRQGDVSVLRSLCQQQQMELEIVAPTRRTTGGGEDTMVSSTRIRELIRQGQIEAANQLLGHPHRIRGEVVRGDQRGRAIGFPTANLAGIDVLVPGPGVYGGVAILEGASVPAAIHLGPRPTFESNDTPQVEVHLLDFSGDLYGQTLEVDVVTQVRDIARFDSAERLIEQLDRDVLTIRRQLSGGPS